LIAVQADQVLVLLTGQKYIGNSGLPELLPEVDYSARLTAQMQGLGHRPRPYLSVSGPSQAPKRQEQCSFMAEIQRIFVRNEHVPRPQIRAKTPTTAVQGSQSGRSRHKMVIYGRKSNGFSSRNGHVGALRSAVPGRL